MAKCPNPPPSAQIVARRRWRPRARSSGLSMPLRGPIPRAATRAAGLAAPDFDPATQLICDRVTFADMRDRLHNALLKLELREQDAQRPEQRNA
jgi:hypothetical protein